MIPLNLPPFPFKTIERKGRTLIFDFLRRRYVTLTPEEWVRQHFVHFLISERGFPQGLLANEVCIIVGGNVRRCDSVLYRREGGQPRAIVEYKAPSVQITQGVFSQIAAYNSVLHADYLIVTNGCLHFCCKMDYAHMSVTFLPEIPHYKQLT